jgi:YD repeat-containing protein
MLVAGLAVSFSVALVGGSLPFASAADYNGTITPGGSAVAVALTGSGDVGRLTFTGAVGDRVFVKASTGSLAGGGRYTVSLLDPNSSSLGSTVVYANSTGFIDTTTLLIAGTYTIQISPYSNTTGTTTVTLYSVPADLSGSITVGGSSVPVSVASPGQNGLYTFSGTAGQRVSLKAVTGALASPAQVTAKILNPTGGVLGSTGYVNASSTGFIEPTTLLTTDTYTVWVDPNLGTTGTTTVTLYDVPADVSGSITAGGSSVPVSLATPGQNGSLTFSGTAGQRVSLKAVTGALASSAQATVQILNPGGGVLGSTGLMNASSTVLIDTKTLLTTGTYTVFVNPWLDTTGTTTVTLYDVPADIVGSAVLSGPPVRVTTAVPGHNPTLTFTGAQYQQVTYTLSGVTTGFGTAEIYGPNGYVSGSQNYGLSASTKGPITLPTDGDYKLVIDPWFANTGSATVQFAVYGDAPLAAAQLTTCGTTPIFRAQPAAGSSVQYQFQVATDSAFASVVSDSGSLPATNTYSPPPSALANGQSYYWRWKTASGSWSTGKNFSLNQSHLGAGSGPLWSYGPLAVNEVTGNLLAALPGPSYPTAVGSMGASVSYNSLDTTNHGLGAGWLLDAGASSAGVPVTLIDQNLLTGANRLDAVAALAADGSSSCFTHVGETNTYVPAPGESAQLSKNADGSWTYIAGDAIANYGAANGTTAAAQLTSVQVSSAAAGNGSLTYSFAAADPAKPTSVTDSSGRTLTFTWNSLNPSGCTGAIVCVTGPDTVTWKYVGDAGSGTSGRLSRVNNGTRDLAAVSYDTSARVNKLQNANDLDATNASPGYDSTHAFGVTYDGNGRVATIADGPISNQSPATSTWSFDYHPGSATTTATATAHTGISLGTTRTAAGYTTVTPPRQQGLGSPLSVKVYYDGHGNTLERGDVLGNHTLAGYNTRDRLIWSEDELGNPGDYVYDTVNDVLTTATGPDPDGAGSLGRPTTGYRYDEKKIGTTSTPGAALEGLQAAYYDNINLAGRPKLRQTDANVDFNWGTSGPSALGTTVDNFSARFSGNLSVTTTGAYTFSTVSDEGTRLTIDGTVAIDNWTDQTVTTKTSQAISLTAGLHKISLEYYEHTGSAEVHLKWSCAACSPVISTQIIPTSALRPAWLNTTSAVSPLGNVVFSHFLAPDAGAADYTQATLANGTSVITSYSYDSYGRITQKVMPMGNTSATIDTDGNLQGTTDAKYITTWDYYGLTETAAPPTACGGGSAVNQAGQLKTKSVYGLTNQTFVYSTAGDQLAKTNAAGSQCFSYGAEGQLTSEEATGDTQATTFTYDPAGQTRTVTNASGTVTMTYDEARHVTRSIDSYGAESTFAYDTEGNLMQRVAAKGALNANTNYTTSYTYNAANELTGVTDPASRAYAFGYDNRGAPRWTQYPNGTYSWNDYNPQRRPRRALQPPRHSRRYRNERPHRRESDRRLRLHLHTRRTKEPRGPYGWQPHERDDHLQLRQSRSARPNNPAKRDHPRLQLRSRLQPHRH